LFGDHEERQKAVEEAKQNVPEGCTVQLESMNRCLNQHDVDPAQCQFLYDYLMECRNASNQAKQ
jgi:hypothetical protein